MRELEGLLREAAESRPASGLDIGDVLQSGRRRVRRRRTMAVAGAVVAVAVIAAGPTLLSGVGVGLSDRFAPAEKEEIVGPVVRPVDASPAVVGEDYDVLTSLTDSSPDPRSQRLFESVTPDGLVVVRDYAARPLGEGQTGLLDPRTGEISWLPGTQRLGGQDMLHDVSDRWLVWQPVIGGPDTALLGVYDRRAGEPRNITIDDKRLDLDPMAYPRGGALGPDDRVYFGVGGGTSSAPMWSVALDDPRDLRNEKVDVGEFVIDGDLLTYTEHTNRPVSTIHVRNLRSGETSSFDALSGETCSLTGLDREGDVIAMRQYCGRADGGHDERVRLISGSGDPILTVRGSGVVAGALTDGHLSFTVGHGAAAGTYVYDLESEELLRVTHRVVSGDPVLVGEGDVLTWATPGYGGRGPRLWVGEFH